MPQSSYTVWPELPYLAWQDTCRTLHLWTQIVGKVRLEQTPWVNHSWHVPLYVTSKGLSTSLIPHRSRSFEIEFDFNAHILNIVVSDGGGHRIALKPQSVAGLYGKILAALVDLDVPVTISDMPCEIEGATAFSRDSTHAAYDADAAQRFWRALLQVDRIFKHFRTAFIGKCSPVHFFWGSFDLAVTRFSGRPAPPLSGRSPGVKPEVMREAYSHEVSSAGFWPGGTGVEYAAFYSYTYPMPPSFKEYPTRPAGVLFNEELGQFLLPYDVVRTAADPDATLLAFLQSTYEAAAVSATWDRAALECELGVPGMPRPLSD